MKVEEENGLRQGNTVVERGEEEDQVGAMQRGERCRRGYFNAGQKPGEEKGEGREKKQERQRKMRGRVINELKHSYGGKVVGEGGEGE